MTVAEQLEQGDTDIIWQTQQKKACFTQKIPEDTLEEACT
jgi:hypothetical protein